MKILYHANCSDGFCAAWVFSKSPLISAEYIPVQYGGQVPNVEGEEVIIVDFSYPLETLKSMKAKTILVLDHHLTCPDSGNYSDSIRIIKDITKSGGQLAWEWVHGNLNYDWRVRYTADRDLWKWELANSREVNEYIRIHPFDFTAWDKMSSGEAVRIGKLLVAKTNEMVERVVEKVRYVTWLGYKVALVNSTVLQSEIGDRLKGECDLAMIYTHTGEDYICSLRSGGVDVCEIAKRFGGGGHKLAAGCRLKELP